MAEATIMDPEVKLQLTAFLYLLMRDEIVPGVIAKIVNELDKSYGSFTFTNKHLAAYATELVERLTYSCRGGIS